jgi:hypothetical protein
MSVRPITDTLRHIGNGVFLDTASDQLNQLVTAVDATGKAGRIDLTVTVKKATKGGAMHISGKVKLTKPAEDAMEALLFVTPEGNLIADNPRQNALDLKVVGEDATPANLKTVNATE